MNHRKLAATAAVAALVAHGYAFAAVSQEEAKKLGTDLTQFGAEKAGSADGSIPAYSAKRITPPSDYKPGSGVFPDPYASEKPLYSVDAKDMAQYKQVLIPGVEHMLQAYPGFRLDVYPTHRDAYYPKWVLDNTVKNATTGQLTGSVEGDGVKDAYGGIPFPIPKNGYEVMWNYFLHSMPPSFSQRCTSLLVENNGHITLLGDFTSNNAYPFYDPSKTGLGDQYYSKQVSTGNAPSSQVGYNILLEYSINYSNADQLNWVYTPGQRRVRTAPEFAYDTPAANFGGVETYDEVYLLSGRLDRFDFKLVGKKEILVPYNEYKLADPSSDPAKFATPNYLNPDYVRWEKHRVWVVEATLKQGKRHVMSRRTYYVDEDSWQILATEGYDQSGKLYRIGLALPYMVYDKEYPFMASFSYFLTDLTKGSYFVNPMGPNGYVKVKDGSPDMSDYTPNRLASSGIR